MQELMQTIVNDPKLLYGLPSSVVTILLIINRIYFSYSHYAKCKSDIEFAIKSLTQVPLSGQERWLFDYYRVIYGEQFKEELITKLQDSLVVLKASPILYGLKLAFSNPFSDDIELGGFPYSFKFFKLSR